jgi:hypothetical protein
MVVEQETASSDPVVTVVKQETVETASSDPVLPEEQMVVDKQETIVPASSDPAEAEQQIVAVENQQETFAAVAPNVEVAIAILQNQQEMLVTPKRNKGKKVINKIGKTVDFEKKESPIISKYPRSSKKKVLLKKSPSVACYDDNDPIPIVMDHRTGNAYKNDVGIFDGAIPLEINLASVREGKKREQEEEDIEQVVEGQETPYIGDVDEWQFDKTDPLDADLFLNDDELIEDPDDATEDKVRTQPSKYQKIKHYTEHS